MTTDAGVRAEVERLRREIERHDQLYYVLSKPEISDPEYDALFRRLQELEKAHPELDDPTSPTKRVGGRPIEGFRTVAHAVPMMSLDNTYDREEVLAFERRIARILPETKFAYVLEPKVDGVASQLRYEKGALVLAATRGDGERGDDITEHVRQIRDVPLRLRGEAPPPELLEVRGEIYLEKKRFERINREREEAGEAPFLNPRNLVSGTLGMLDPSFAHGRGLRFVAHGTGAAKGFEPRSYWELLQAIAAWSIPTNPNAQRFETIEEVIAFIDAFGTKRRELPYETDGVVVKVDDRHDQSELGSTSRAPRWAIAFKYPPDQATTRVRAIEVFVGRSGALTPVAALEPVFLSGVMIRNASLHNFDELARKDVRAGDHVLIERAGEVIPYVVKALHERRTGDEKPFPIPTSCPVCGTPVERAEGEAILRCPNAECPAKVMKEIEAFAGRHALDIEGMGPKLVEHLYARGLVRSIGDIPSLVGKRAELLELERMGEKSADNLIARIEAAKSRGLEKLLVGLAIPLVGGTIAQGIARRFGSLEAIEAANEEALVAKGIGRVVARNLRAWLDAPRNKEILQKLRAAGFSTRATGGEEGSASGVLSGKSFVITGTLPKRSRDETKALIVRAGGRVAESVSKSTSYVVAGEKPGSKLDKAKSLGIPVIDEAGLEGLLGITG